MRAAHILALANQKGGVGKTTTAINLAASIAARHRVLLVDLDPQGNASTGLGVPAGEARQGSYRLLNGEAVTPIPTSLRGLAIVAADADLAAAELNLIGRTRREFHLRDALQRWRDEFEFILLDCPPSLNMLTLNALVAADGVIVPLQCEFFALEGIGHLMRTIEAVRHGPNSRAHVQGIVLTMFDRRNNLSELVASDARGFFGAKVYDTVIPRNVRVSEAPSHGSPVVLYDFRSPGAQAYVRLAGEVLRRSNAGDPAAR